MRGIQSVVGFAIAAALVSSSAKASEDQGLDLGLRLGYGIPLGSVAGTANGGDSVSLNDFVSGQVPIWVDAGYRFNPNIMAGLYFMYGFAFPADNACPSPASCSGSDIRFGIQGQYRFSPREKLDPWLGLGVGYEWLHESASVNATVAGLSASASASSLVHGWEFLHLQGGVDFQVADGVGIGPFLDFSFGEYSSGSVSAGGQAVGSGDIQNEQLHEWFTLGVRVVYDP